MFPMPESEGTAVASFSDQGYEATLNEKRIFTQEKWEKLKVAGKVKKEDLDVVLVDR